MGKKKDSLGVKSVKARREILTDHLASSSSMLTVFCTTQFEGWHCWPEAPKEYAYLRSSHRHLFNVRVTVEVSSGLRQIEFIHLKHLTEQACLSEHVFSRDFENPTYYSCEQMAQMILIGLYLIPELEQPPFIQVRVDEDGENGGDVTYIERGPR